MSRDSRIGTPEPIRDASVLVIRASAILWKSGPNTGGLSMSRSHLRRPSSVAIHFRTPMMAPTITAMTKRIQALVTMFEISMRTLRRERQLAAQVT